MSAEAESLGDKNFEERDVEYGNLSKAVKCYKEAISYLETVKTKLQGLIIAGGQVANAEKYRLSPKGSALGQIKR